MNPIKVIFSAIASNNSFASNSAQKLTESIPEFIQSNLFSSGKQCELLRLGSSSWEPLIFGIQFTIDAIEDLPAIDGDISIDKIVSPLDEIRNIAF